MLSATSFTDELRRFSWPKSSAIRQHLTEWSKDDRAEEVWQKIRENSDGISAEEFIRVVIKARGEAGGLIHRLDQHASYRKHWIRAHKAKITKTLKSTLSLSEIADVLDGAAVDFRTVDDFFDHLLNRFPMSRKNQNNSLARRPFWFLVGRFLHKKCGRWMDAEVATLTDIAFPGIETTIDQVRAARRPTTSSGRSSKGNQARH